MQRDGNFSVVEMCLVSTNILSVQIIVYNVLGNAWLMSHLFYVLLHIFLSHFSFTQFKLIIHIIVFNVHLVAWKYFCCL